jgi:hypothetical protein
MKFNKDTSGVYVLDGELPNGMYVAKFSVDNSNDWSALPMKGMQTEDDGVDDVNSVFKICN